MLRTVTFWMKLRCFHTTPTFSSSTRLPEGGDLGRMSLAGWLISSAKQAVNAESTTQSIATSVHQNA